MAASNEMIFLIIGIGLLTYSSLLVLACNYLFSRVKRILIFFYIFIILSFICFWSINYWGRSEMNSASIKLSSKSVELQFSSKTSGKYNIFLTFLSDKANNTFKRCEFFWLKDKKSFTDCKTELIYKKIMVRINKKIIYGQYNYRDMRNRYEYGYNFDNVSGKNNPSLNLEKLDLKKNELVNIKIFIDTSYTDILKDQPVLMIGPDPAFYYEGNVVGLLLLIISIPILISIIYFVRSRPY